VPGRWAARRRIALLRKVQGYRLKAVLRPTGRCLEAAAAGMTWRLRRDQMCGLELVSLVEDFNEAQDGRGLVAGIHRGHEAAAAVRSGFERKRHTGGHPGSRRSRTGPMTRDGSGPTRTGGSCDKQDGGQRPPMPPVIQRAAADTRQTGRSGYGFHIRLRPVAHTQTVAAD